MKVEEIKELRNKNLEIEKIISQYKMEIHDLIQEKNIMIARKDSVQLKKSLSKSDAVDQKAEKLLNDFNNRIKDLDVKILDKAAKLNQNKIVVENNKKLVNEELDEVKKNPAVLQHYNNKLIEKNNEKINELSKKQERITDFKTLVNTFPGLKMNFKTMVICGKEMRRIQKELDKVEQKYSEVMKRIKEPNARGLLQDKRNLESEKSTLKKSLQEAKIRYNEAKSLTIANMNTYSKYSKSFIGKELVFSAEEMETMANSGKVHYERKDNGDLDFDVNSVLDSQIKGVSRDIKNHQMTNEVLKDEINGISNFLVDKRAQAAEEARIAEEERKAREAKKAEEAAKKQGKNKGNKNDPFAGIDLGFTKTNPPETDLSFMDSEEDPKPSQALVPIPEKSRLSMFFKGIAEWFKNRFKKPEKGEPEPTIETTPVENIDLKDKDIEFLNELKVDLEYEKHNEEIMKYVARDNRKKEKQEKEK